MEKKLETAVAWGTNRFTVVSGDPYHCQRYTVDVGTLSADEAEGLAAALLAAVAMHRNMSAALRLAPAHVAEIVADVAADSLLPTNASVVGGAT